MAIALLSPSLRASGESREIHGHAYWVFFNDKNANDSFQISERASSRRLKRASLADYSVLDTPVDKASLNRLVAAGANIRTVSRWLNAASIEADSITVALIGAFPFVREILPVSSYTQTTPLETFFSFEDNGKMSLFDYGPSRRQVSMLAIDSLHNAGLSGRDVIIGVMDTGFDTSHVAFRQLGLEHRILATYDFINSDSNVMDLLDAQRFHGTAVLSCMAGFDEGNIVGTAFGAEYILAKTEILSEEIQAEEDYWVAAAEWMESLGVDIISSSLGYIDWYDTTQLDGQTAVITRAANAANSLGVIVVNCAGNEGNTPWHKVNPPADGDSVIAVGAVGFDGVVTSFSSRGPTADGRVKPDFCAPGLGDYAAIYTGGYGVLSGTSFSTPLIAGGIALLLESHPDWTLHDIIGNLKRASSRAGQPNNSYGWGIPNFVNAIYMQPFEPRSQPAITIAPHPAVDSVIFFLTFIAPGPAALSVHDLSGAKIQEWSVAVDNAGTIIQTWDGANSSAEKIASGIYIVELKQADLIVRQKLAYIAR